MALKRVFAGFYTRYDGKPIFVVRVLKDIDTGESIVVCKDASFSKEDNDAIATSSGTPPSASRSKSMVCCGINTSIKPGARSTKAPSAKCMGTAFLSPRASPSLTLMTSTQSEPSVAAEPTTNTLRISVKTTGWICGDTSSSGSGSSTSAYPTARHIRPCVRISRLPSSRSKRCSTTTLISSGNVFPRGCPSAKQRMPMQQNRGVIERRQAALYRAFAQLLQQRDEADGVCRLMRKTEYDQGDIEDLLE